MIKHVWFDTSGTLYRELPEYQAAHDDYLYKEMAAVTGETDIEKLKAQYADLYEQHGSNSAVFQALGKPVDYWQKKFEGFDSNSWLKPDPEITDTLRQLKDRLAISLFTNLRIGKLEDLLQDLEIPRQFFTNVLSATDVGKPKPDLAGFHKMVELTGVDAAEILYVGDKVNKDIKPAKKVGMITCLVYSYSPEADYSIDAFPELLKIVTPK